MPSLDDQADLLLVGIDLGQPLAESVGTRFEWGERYGKRR
jgi:hypothetical protein